MNQCHVFNGLTASMLHYGSVQRDSETSTLTLSHELGSEQTSKRLSAAERASEASSAELINGLAVRTKEQTDGRVAQY